MRRLEAYGDVERVVHLFQETLVEAFNDTWNLERPMQLLPELVEVLRSASEASAVPVDVRAVGEFCGVQAWADETDQATYHGSLWPGPEGVGFRVQAPNVERNYWSPITRAVCAHEIGHVLFHSWGAGAPERLPIRGTIASTRHEERFCEAFARELLLPMRHLGPLRSGDERPSADALERLMTAFEVTLNKAAGRIYRDLRCWPESLAFEARAWGSDPRPKGTAFTFRGTALPGPIKAPAVCSVMEELRPGDAQTVNVGRHELLLSVGRSLPIVVATLGGCDT